MLLGSRVLRVRDEGRPSQARPTRVSVVGAATGTVDGPPFRDEATGRAPTTLGGAAPSPRLSPPPYALDDPSMMSPTQLDAAAGIFAASMLEPEGPEPRTSYGSAASSLTALTDLTSVAARRSVRTHFLALIEGRCDSGDATFGWTSTSPRLGGLIQPGEGSRSCPRLP